MNKITRIIFIIGIFSSIILVLITAFVFFIIYNDSKNVNSESTDRCLDGRRVILDTQIIDSSPYQLIYNQSGFSDKVEFLHLYKGDRPRKGGCIRMGDIVFTENLYYGPEHGPIEQWPMNITIIGNSISVAYSNNPTESVPVFNVPIIWGE